MIKHDDSGAGDGNAVIDLGPMDAAADPRSWLREQVEALPDWYRDDLARGGIVANINIDMFLPLYPLERQTVFGLNESDLTDDVNAVAQ